MPVSVKNFILPVYPNWIPAPLLPVVNLVTAPLASRDIFDPINNSVPPLSSVVERAASAKLVAAVVRNLIFGVAESAAGKANNPVGLEVPMPKFPPFR